MAWSADGIEFGEGDVVYDGNGKRYVVEEISFQSEFVNRPDGIYLVDDNDNIEFLFGSEVYVLFVNNPHEARRRVAHEVIDQDEDEFYCPTCDEVTMTSMEVVGRPACGQCQTTYPCPECGAPELDEPDHDSDKPFMCDSCGAVFDESNLGTTGRRKKAWMKSVRPPFSEEYSHLKCPSCGYLTDEDMSDPSICPECGYGDPDWVHPNFRAEAGSMEQDMGNLAESFDGGSASGGGGGAGGYIYDVSDYDTYARTYRTITDVPEGSDDSAPATTGSKRTARMVDHLNDNAPFRCGTFPSGEDAGVWAIEGCDNIIKTGDRYYEDHDGQGLCASCAAKYDDETNAYFSRRTASDMGIGHRWDVIDYGSEDGYRIWKCEDCGETAATDLDRPWEHPDEFMGDCQTRWNDGVYTATRRTANQYVEKRGDKWVVTQKGTGKVLSEHDTKEKAEASFRAMMSNKHGGSRKTAAVVDVYLAEYDSGYGFTDWSSENVDDLITLRHALTVAVGELNDAAAETAYAICNSYPGELHCSTIYADDVDLYRRYGNRSLSVGDAVTVDGVWYVVADFGFSKIDNPSSYGIVVR